MTPKIAGYLFGALGRVRGKCYLERTYIFGVLAVKQSYKVFKLGKQAVSGVLEAGQMRSIGLAAGLVALGGVSATELQAQTVTYWADWTLPSYTINNNSGVASTYASGATGSINNNGATVGLSLTGEVNAVSVDNASNWYGSTYNPASAYTDTTNQDNVGNGPNGTDRIAQTGFTATADKAHTLTFGSSVQDVVMAVWSLGNPSVVSSLLFTQDFEILSSDRMTKNVTANGYELEGYEGAGIIQFLGSYSSISWTVTAPEFYSAFNVGITNNPVTTAAGAVLAIPQSTRDITASNDIHTDLGNSSPTNAQLNYVFDGGTLSLGADLSDNFSIKSGGGSVSVTGALTNRTLSGVLSDNGSANGSLTKVGSGALKLTGTNTYTGATTVTAGRLEIASSGSIDGSSLTNNSQVDLYGSVDVTGAVINASTFNLVGGSITAANGFSNTGSLNVSGSGTSTIVGNVLSSGSYGRIAAGADLTITGDLENSSTASDLVTGGVNLGQMWTFNGTTLNVTGALTNNNRFFVRDNSTVSANSSTNTSNGEISLQVGAVLSWRLSQSPLSSPPQLLAKSKTAVGPPTVSQPVVARLFSAA